MRIVTIRSEGLAALSYFVSSKNEAMVIDPRRDASVYGSLARDSSSEIIHIFETHRNEDYVIGSLELQSYHPAAEIGHSKATKFDYGDINIADGETFQIGKMRVTCLNTPGHTDDSMCYVVVDTSVSPNPQVMFTGDTLFVNEVGRTDLVDITKHELMSRKLYKSLHEKVLTYADDVTIHPGHGAGSVCGGAISEQETSTIGFEKENNIWLALEEEDFVNSKVRQQLTRASYFKRCEKLNTDGPPLLSTLKSIEEFEADEYEKLLENPDHRGIDTRPSADFVKSHIPGSISLSLSNIGLLAGWALRDHQNFSFILGDVGDLELATSSFYRVGLDNVIGYLQGGFSGWTNSNKITDSIKTISSDEFKTSFESGSSSIVDVRESHEFEFERIPSSSSAPLTKLEEEANALDISKQIVTICPSGYRSTTAASIMKRHGIEDVLVYLAGLNQWQEDGNPME